MEFSQQSNKYIIKSEKHVTMNESHNTAINAAINKFFEK